MMLWKRVIAWQKNGTFSLSRETPRHRIAEGPLFRKKAMRPLQKEKDFRQFADFEGRHAFQIASSVVKIR